MEYRGPGDDGDVRALPVELPAAGAAGRDSNPDLSLIRRSNRRLHFGVPLVGTRGPFNTSRPSLLLVLMRRAREPFRGGCFLRLLCRLSYLPPLGGWAGLEPATHCSRSNPPLHFGHAMQLSRERTREPNRVRSVFCWQEVTPPLHFASTHDTSTATQPANGRRPSTPLGIPVWDEKARRNAFTSRPISNKERREVLRRDGFVCTVCGIAGGEPYPDDRVVTALLVVSRRSLVGDNVGENLAWVTECIRCRAGGGAEVLSPQEALRHVKDLQTSDTIRLLRWMERGHRGTTELDRAWSAFLRVPPEMRPLLIERLRETLPLANDPSR